MDYHQRVTLLAYYKQEKYGMYSPEKDTNTGYFDLVGSDRRYVCTIVILLVLLYKMLHIRKYPWPRMFSTFHIP